MHVMLCSYVNNLIQLNNNIIINLLLLQCNVFVNEK